MTDSKLVRRDFLRSSGLTLAGLLSLPTVMARAEGNKVAVPLAKLEMLKTVGGSVVIKVKDKLVLLIRDTATSVKAYSPICTHLHCVVAYRAGENKIKCPCHGSEFDIDGQVVHGPAPRRLEAYAATLDAERIVVTL
jgi:cytochrome b6-f complex iron-sulfur subunit